MNPGKRSRTFWNSSDVCWLCFITWQKFHYNVYMGCVLEISTSSHKKYLDFEIKTQSQNVARTHMFTFKQLFCILHHYYLKQNSSHFYFKIQCSSLCGVPKCQLSA